MASSLPFRCSKCNKIQYRRKANAKLDCCKDANTIPLVVICHLVPCPTNQEPQHKSVQKEGVVDHNREWIIACGKDPMPPHRTDQLLAVTCKDCLKIADENLKANGSSLQEYNESLAQSIEEANEQESPDFQENESLDSDTEVVVESDDESSKTPDSP